MRDLTVRQLTSVACPACGVPPGERCLWRSGSSRTEPHLDRKLIAAETIEQERDSRWSQPLTELTKENEQTNLPRVIEELRQHTPEQLAELRILLNAGLDRADTRRPGFFEIDGAANVYYVLRYPFRHKVLLVAAWDRQGDPKAEFVVCT